MKLSGPRHLIPRYCWNPANLIILTGAILSAVARPLLADSIIGSWQVESSSYPVSVYGHAVATWKNHIYVTGGVQSTTAVFRASANVDGSLAPWIASTNTLASPARWHGMAVWKGRLYVAGGGNTLSEEMTVQYSQIQSDGNTGPWIISQTKLPDARIFHDMTAWKGHLYISGGLAGSSGRQTVYHAAINEDGSVAPWSRGADLPAGRLDHLMLAQNDRLYVLGGDAVAVGLPQSSVFHAQIKLDGSLGPWVTSSNPLPGARSKPAGTVCNGTIYAGGGRAGPFPHYAETFHTHISSTGEIGAWSIADPSLPEPRSDAVMSSLGQKLFFVAGSTIIQNGELGINTVYSISATNLKSCLPFSGQPIGISSITWTWENIDTNSSFRVLSSTDGNVSGDLPAGTTAWIETGLATNTAYMRKLVAFQGAEFSTSSLVARYTLSAIPNNLAVTGVSSHSISVSWSANANAPGTLYELFRSTGESFGLIFTGSTTVFISTGLAASTTYSFRVEALNGDSISSGFDAAASTRTLPPLPGGSGTPAGTALGVSSMTWTWSAGSNAIDYRVFLATDTATVLSTTTQTTFIRTGLSPNTTHAIVVQGSNATGLGPQSGPSPPVYTHANPPMGSTAAVVGVTSATIAWGLNGNPVQTTADVQRSTDSIVYSAAFQGSTTAFTDTGLVACSTYFFRIRNLNGNAVTTAFDAVVEFVTLASTPSPPSDLQAASLEANRISLTWGASPSGDVTGYRLFYDSGTGSVNYTAPLAAVSSSAASFTTGILASSASYTFGLRAVNRCGIQESNTNLLAGAASVASLQGIQASVKIPKSGQKIAGNRVTVMAAMVAAEEARAKEILFQFKPTASGLWTNIPAADSIHPNPDRGAPYFIHWNVTGLASGDYQLRAVATDIQGQLDGAPPTITVSVDPTDPDILENDIGGGRIQKAQKVINSVSNTIQSTDGTTAQITTLALPIGALNTSTATITMINGGQGAPASPAGAAPMGLAAEISLSNGQTLLAGSLSANISITYPDADDDRRIDGKGERVDRLKIYSAAGTTSDWIQDVQTTADSQNKTIVGLTRHLSFFSVFAPSAISLEHIRVYPIPYIPNNNSSDDGVPYTPGNPNSGIIFDNLPSPAAIKIYTLSGEKVASFGAEVTSGRLQWDVRNDSGQEVASGAYLAVITSFYGRSGVKKILIIR